MISICFNHHSLPAANRDIGTYLYLELMEGIFHLIDDEIAMNQIYCQNHWQQQLSPDLTTSDFVFNILTKTNRDIALRIAHLIDKCKKTFEYYMSEDGKEVYNSFVSCLNEDDDCTASDLIGAACLENWVVGSLATADKWKDQMLSIRWLNDNQEHVNATSHTTLNFTDLDSAKLIALYISNLKLELKIENFSNIFPECIRLDPFNEWISIQDEATLVEFMKKLKFVQSSQYKARARSPLQHLVNSRNGLLELRFWASNSKTYRVFLKHFGEYVILIRGMTKKSNAEQNDVIELSEKDFENCSYSKKSA